VLVMQILEPGQWDGTHVVVAAMAGAWAVWVRPTARSEYAQVRVAYWLNVAVVVLAAAAPATPWWP